MPEKNPLFNTSQPDIFSRGSLKLTFDIVRKKNPQLALTIQNITRGEPILMPETDPDNNTDYFKVALDSFQVRDIVELLMKYNQPGNTKVDAGMTVVAKALFEEWMSLANTMVAKLPGNRKPV